MGEIQFGMPMIHSFNMRQIFSFLAAILAGVFLVGSFYPVLSDVAIKCWTNDDYSHGVLLPFVSLALFWLKRDELIPRVKEAFAEDLKFSWLGFLLLAFGLGIDVFAEVSGQLLFVRWIAFFFVAVGFVCLIFGTKAGLIFAPLILLNFMARPIPESIVPILFNPLQVLAANIGGSTLEMLGVPVYMQGNIIEVPGLRLLVEEACSGMRSVVSLLTVACIVTYLVNLRFFGFVFISVIAVVVAIILNILRVTLTGILAHFVDQELATGFFHEFTGMVVFIVGLAILYAIARWMVSLSDRFRFGGKL